MRLRFVFRIRTKTGGIVGSIVIEARDQFEAVQKLQQRYPDCTILNCEVRRCSLVYRQFPSSTHRQP